MGLKTWLRLTMIRGDAREDPPRTVNGFKSRLMSIKEDA